MFQNKQIIEWINKSSELITLKKEYLTELDSAIGDGDHGINMKRAFIKLNKIITENSPKTISETLKLIGITLLSNIGGASGPLYGTFFLRMSQFAHTKQSLNINDIILMIEKGTQGIIERGKAKLDDKTMVDVWLPFVKRAKQGINENLPLNDFCTQLEKVAEESVEYTINLIAKKGRASYLGERSIGHQDPGATSSLYLIKTLINILKQTYA